jgi:hypothetical protein
MRLHRMISWIDSELTVVGIFAKGNGANAPISN